MLGDRERKGFNLRDSSVMMMRKKKRKMVKITSSSMMMMMMMMMFLVLSSFFGFVFGQSTGSPFSRSSHHSSVSALFIIGDSSVSCSRNNTFNSFLRSASSVYPCEGTDSRLLPDLLAEKMGLPDIPPFSAENGTIEGLLSGLNFGSFQSSIMSSGKLLGFQGQNLNQQLRQAFETFQILELQLGFEKAQEIIGSSVFYISLGKDDYIDFSSNVRRRYRRRPFASILVKQMIRVAQDLYSANVRKIIFMGIEPLGCAPRILLESSNSTNANHVSDASNCVEDINDLVLEYNAMLSKQLFLLNFELADAQIVFCDVYQGMMEIITFPERYGFHNVSRACCGLGAYGAAVGCLVKEMACDDPSTHIWWDFYNPTKAVISLLSDSAWFGQPFDICRPININQMTSTILR